MELNALDMMLLRLAPEVSRYTYDDDFQPNEKYSLLLPRIIIRKWLFLAIGILLACIN
jgi:hypothetical protein